MIKVEHLTKYYGDFLAVDDLSFEIDEGHVYGFLGPNGAGKSTTMNIMTGCLSATSGHVEVGGYDIFEDANKAKRLIGYLPEQPPLYMNETPEEYLRFVGEAKGLRGSELEDQIDKVIDQVKIQSVRGRRISALSKGYKQRVGIAQALLGNPRIIILDEPTVGLDPIQIIEIRDLIKQLGQEHTVILSSHILSEVQAICEKILIIAHGKPVAFDEPDNLEKSLLSGNEIVFTTDAEEDTVMDILSGVEHISGVQLKEKENGLVSAQLKTDSSDIYAVSRQLFFAFAEHGQALLELSLKKSSLEDIFIELTESGDPGHPGPGEPEDIPEEQTEASSQDGDETSAGTESEADQV